MTSSIKSELGIPPDCTDTCGVPVSAAAIAAVGRSAEGRGAAGIIGAEALALSIGNCALAAPVSATPARNLRRFNRARTRAISASCDAGPRIRHPRTRQMTMLVQPRERRYGGSLRAI